MERQLYQELSKYYLLPERKKEWARPALLVKGKHAHDPQRTDNIPLTQILSPERAQGL